VPAQPGLTCGLAAVRYRERFDAIVLQRQFFLGTVQPASQAAEVAATHSGGFRPGDRAAAVPDAASRFRAGKDEPAEADRPSWTVPEAAGHLKVHKSTLYRATPPRP
jgi:hypothetical protein